MFNFHNELFAFYEERVRLKENRKQLWDYRDKGVERIREGTRKLSTNNGVQYPMFTEEFSQGSMAMHTINQAQNDDDHDIDHALVYRNEDVPPNPAEAKAWVLKTLLEAGGNFKKEPEARTNAVTVWYDNGHHVDFAIYKLIVDSRGNKRYFHAGPEWAERNPRAITEWFDHANKSRSPDASTWALTGVAPGQLRRVVRLFKFWSKSRADWSLPSGLALTVLVVECYQSHTTCDDVAFLNTLRSICNRLQSNKSINNPTDQSLSLLTKPEHNAQVATLTSRLNLFLNELEKVVNSGVASQHQVTRAWSAFFGTNFWGVPKDQSDALNTLDISKAEFEIYYKKGERGSIRRYDPIKGSFIPIGMVIDFRVRLKLPKPYCVSWKVKNSGDEAEREKQCDLRDGRVDLNDECHCIEQSKFRGDHKMICIVECLGQRYQREIPVRIR